MLPQFFACREAFWCSRAKIRICTALLYLNKWHCRVSYSRDSRNESLTVDLLDQRMIEKSWRLPLLPVSLRGTKAGRRSPECHCRTWWAFWLNKRVCSTFYHCFIFFPPMPAPISQFQDRRTERRWHVGNNVIPWVFPQAETLNLTALPPGKVLGPDSRASLCSSSTTLWNRVEKQAQDFNARSTNFFPPRWTDFFKEYVEVWSSILHLFRIWNILFVFCSGHPFVIRKFMWA